MEGLQGAGGPGAGRSAGGGERAPSAPAWQPLLRAPGFALVLPGEVLGYPHGFFKAF